MNTSTATMANSSALRGIRPAKNPKVLPPSIEPVGAPRHTSAGNVSFGSARFHHIPPGLNSRYFSVWTSHVGPGFPGDDPSRSAGQSHHPHPPLELATGLDIVLAHEVKLAVVAHAKHREASRYARNARTVAHVDRGDRRRHHQAGGPVERKRPHVVPVRVGALDH